MTLPTSRLDIVDLDEAEIRLEPWSWEFAHDRQKDIERNFSHLKQERSVWNGRVLLLHRYAIHNGKLHGACFEADYASLMAWCDWDFPDGGVYNFYAAAALRSADGAYLVGEMAAHTANAGEVYFPCGTPEPFDVLPSGRLDLEANLARELREETGLAMTDLVAAKGWRLVRDRNYIALTKLLVSRQSAGDLRDRIMRHLAADKHAELSDIHILRSPADLNDRMPRGVSEFLQAEWRGAATA